MPYDDSVRPRLGVGPPVRRARHLVIPEGESADYHFTRARYAKIHLVATELRDCLFEDVRTDYWAVSGDLQVRSRVANCDFVRCDLKANLITNVTFENCRFRECTLRNWGNIGADYLGCTFSGAILSGFFDAHLSRVNPAYSAGLVIDNDFTQADLVDVDFRGGVDLFRQSLPGGSTYRVIEDSHAMILYLSRNTRILPVSDPSRKTDLEVFAALLNADYEQGQKQKLIDQRELAASVWSAIQASGLARPVQA